MRRYAAGFLLAIAVAGTGTIAWALWREYWSSKPRGASSTACHSLPSAVPARALPRPTAPRTASEASTAPSAGDGPQLPGSSLPRSQQASRDGTRVPLVSTAHLPACRGPHELRAGSMGCVYVTTWHGRRVAVKVARSHPSRHGSLLGEFRANCHVLRCRGVVPLLAAAAECSGCDGARWTEQGPGELQALVFAGGKDDVMGLAQRAALSDKCILAIGEQCLAALAELQECGVVHRDVKPQNIILFGEDADAFGHAHTSAGAAAKEVYKLGDFGVACRLGQQTNAVGTRQYNAPEAVAGSLRAGPTLDTWSLGASLLHLLLLARYHCSSWPPPRPDVSSGPRPPPRPLGLPPGALQPQPPCTASKAARKPPRPTAAVAAYGTCRGNAPVQPTSTQPPPRPPTAPLPPRCPQYSAAPPQRPCSEAPRPSYLQTHTQDKIERKQLALPIAPRTSVGSPPRHNSDAAPGLKWLLNKPLYDMQQMEIDSTLEQLQCSVELRQLVGMCLRRHTGANGRKTPLALLSLFPQTCN